MNRLFVLKEYEDGSVLVGDEAGSSQFLTKAEYKLYIKNRAKAKQHIEIQERYKNPA